jgi:hypothetical protein
VFVTILVAGGVTTGALAATGQLTVISSNERGSNPNYMVMKFPGFDSAPTEAPTLLPMRVKDPSGGPDWALRTFPVGRGRVCGQVGQVYEGKFGIVTPVRDPSRNTKGDNAGPAWSMSAFQELPASVGMQGVRCGPVRTGGVVVTGSSQTIVDGVEGADLRCSNVPAPDGSDCRITGVRAVRWGLLGPEAKTATFVHPGAAGRRGPTQKLDPATDGAYLFVEAIDPEPFRASRAFEVELRKKIDAKFPRVPYGSIPKAERPAADRRWRQRNAYVGEVYRAARNSRRDQWRAQQAGAVEATFDGAPDRRVAGPGASGAPLPGVPAVDTSVPRLPSPGKTPIDVTFRGLERAAEVRFRSPVALDHRPGNYLITVNGPGVGACGRNYVEQAVWARETAAGEAVLMRMHTQQITYVKGASNNTMSRPTGKRWCAGDTYTARVRHVVRNRTKPGYRSDQLVGQATFVAR